MADAFEFASLLADEEKLTGLSTLGTLLPGSRSITSGYRFPAVTGVVKRFIQL